MAAETKLYYTLVIRRRGDDDPDDVTLHGHLWDGTRAGALRERIERSRPDLEVMLRPVFPPTMDDIDVRWPKREDANA